jgi:hypothetical protein
MTNIEHQGGNPQDPEIVKYYYEAPLIAQEYRGQKFDNVDASPTTDDVENHRRLHIDPYYTGKPQ